MTPEQRYLWVATLTDMDAPFWLVNKCVHRMTAGADKYGDYDKKKDKRNLVIEVEKELLDAINYLLMEYEGEDEQGLLTDLIALTVKVRGLRG